MHKKKRSSVYTVETAASTDASIKFKKSRIIERQSSSFQQDNNQTVFVQFLLVAGVSLSQDSAANELAVDQVVFHKRLQQQLRRSPRYPEIVKEFITGLEAHIDDPARFKNCLLPCIPRQVGGASSSVSFQESLIRLLLGVDMLQTLIINTLFEKLPEFMFDSSAVDGLNIPRVIVNQLKWLDRVLDSNDLTAKLMQLIVVAPLEVQSDIITSIPEILEDSQHTDVARQLNSLLQQNTQLSGPILDVLSSLNLTGSLLTEVRVGVMATLRAVELEDLPMVVKFILHSISSCDACQVVCDLRKKLDLELCVPPALLASQIHGNHTATAGCSSTAAVASRQDSISMVLDVIKSTMRFQKTLSEVWLKTIESIDEADDLKVIDLLVLFILHSTSSQSRRGVERVLRQKLRMGLVQEALLHSTFISFSQVLRGYFPSILALAQTLLRSRDASVMPFAGSMYTHAFTAFDSYCKQEVVGSLVTHVCSGVGGEVCVALELLCGLVEEQPSEMSLYAAFIKGVLEYLDNCWSPQQIRRLFHLLSSLASTRQHHAIHIQDDMHIVLRKQLSSPVLKYKRMGIMGGVMVVGSLGAHRPRVEDPAGSSMSKETYRQVTSLLELVQSCSRSSPEAQALYYDELADLITTHTLDPQVQAWIGRSVMEDFQKDFVVDVGEDMTGSFLFPPCEMYDLEDDDGQKDFAINLLPLLAGDLQHRDDMSSLPGRASTDRRVSPLCLAPFFRLLRLCESKQNQGDLENIDGLLGCPLVLTDFAVLEKKESLTRPERDFFCALLFYTINWFREVVNAFCRQTDPESKQRVLTRIQNISHLQSVLERALAGTPGFTPPLANFDGESSDVVPASGSAAQRRKGKKDSSGKMRKAGNSATDASQLEEENEETQQEVRETMLEVSLEGYQPFFRELDLEVLSLLSRPLLDVELSTKEKECVQLGPAELVFLLKDMMYKLEFSLAASPAKRPVFFKVKADRTVGFSHLQQKSPKDIASCCVRLLPALCSHLQNCHTYFQSLLSENQGVVDGGRVDLKEHQLMSTGYQLLLQVLHITFSWSGFCEVQQRGLLKESLGVLAKQLYEGGAEPSLDQLTKRGFEYLLNFRSSVPSLSSALTLTQLLSAVAGRGASPAAYREQIASLARHYLCQEWVTASGERESKYNDSLTAILSIYLGHCEDVLKAIEEIAGEGIPQLLNAAKQASSSSWPTLTRQTFLVFYKGMMAELEKAVRKILPGKHSDSTEVQREKLLMWNLAVRDFHFLVNLVKVFDSKPVLNVCLKYGRLFLESFLRLGMPLLDFIFIKHKEDAQSLLKTFQLSTRQLHHMCGHSKICQATALTNHVPALKKSLEQFVYRVKATLTLNHCQEAFWLGNLKNRDLKGDEILSQRVQESEEEAEEDEQLAQDQSDDEAQEEQTERITNSKRPVEEEEDDVTDDSDDD